MRVLRYMPAGLLFLCTAAVVWTGLLLPPPLWILKYGLTPGCEPTGRTWTIEGVEFVEIGRGISRMGSNWLAVNRKGDISTRYLCSAGDTLGRVVRPMGIDWGEAILPSNEMPVHWVEFPRGFGIARTEVTNSQYERFDPQHERRFSSGDAEPVVYLSMDEVRRYCAWLSAKSELTVRLPSESEWECACRTGTITEYAFGDVDTKLGQFAWYDKNAPKGPHEVAKKRANTWGLFDMGGNVWEWCEDLWHDSYLQVRSVAPRQGASCSEKGETAPTDGSAWMNGDRHFRVVRGGGWGYAAPACRSADRNRILADHASDRTGIRPAFTPPDR